MLYNNKKINDILFLENPKEIIIDFSNILGQELKEYPVELYRIFLAAMRNDEFTFVNNCLDNNLDKFFYNENVKNFFKKYFKIYLTDKDRFNSFITINHITIFKKDEIEYYDKLTIFSKRVILQPCQAGLDLSFFIKSGKDSNVGGT